MAPGRKFYQQRVPELRAAGWQVLVRPDLQFNLANGGRLVKI